MDKQLPSQYQITFPFLLRDEIPRGVWSLFVQNYTKKMPNQNDPSKKWKIKHDPCKKMDKLTDEGRGLLCLMR